MTQISSKTYLIFALFLCNTLLSQDQNISIEKLKFKDYLYAIINEKHIDANYNGKIDQGETIEYQIAIHNPNDYAFTQTESYFYAKCEECPENKTSFVKYTSGRIEPNEPHITKFTHVVNEFDIKKNEVNIHYDLQFTNGWYDGPRSTIGGVSVGIPYDVTTNLGTNDIVLTAYYDENDNGEYDIFEPKFKHGFFDITINNTEQRFLNTSEGSITLKGNQKETNYKIKFAVNPNYSRSYESKSDQPYLQKVIYTSTQYKTDSKEFFFPIAISPNASYNRDIQVNLGQVDNPPRVGTEFTQRIFVSNLGDWDTPATINFIKSSLVDLVDVRTSYGNSIKSASRFSSNENGFSYFFSTDLIKNNFIDVVMKVRDATELNTEIVNQVEISDFWFNTNTTFNKKSVLKQVVQELTLQNNIVTTELNDFNSFNTLTNTIHFYNSTEEVVETVHLSSAFDNSIDINKFLPLSTTHEFTIEKIGSVIYWTFNNINLKPGEAGNVIYSINTPYLKEPIQSEITTTITLDDKLVAERKNMIKFGSDEELSSKTFESSKFIFGPNPVKDQLEIQSFSNLIQISIYSNSGALLFSKKTENLKRIKIGTSWLPKGIYITKVLSKDGLESFKFLKN